MIAVILRSLQIIAFQRSEDMVNCDLYIPRIMLPFLLINSSMSNEHGILGKFERFSIQVKWVRF